MNLLRQSTSQIIRFGPELDSTDGVTPETGLTIAQADMQLSKDGAAFAQKNASGNATHDTDGWYSTTLDATDTATNGILLFQVNVAGALPVWHEFYVVPATSYDALTTSGLNNVAATDIVSAGAITTLTGAIVNVDLVDILTTYTGDTPQTADHTAAIADIPTVAEFNARTLVAASYFDPAADTVATVTSVTNQVTADVTAISGDTTAANNLEADYDGTGFTKTNSTIGTCTTNTDQRGTDSALLAANVPTNFTDLSITVTTGLVDITQTAADKVWSTAARILTAATNITSDATAITMSSSGVVGTVNLVNTTTTNTDQRGTDSAALATALATAQLDLDTITGADGTTLATLQPNYDFGTVTKNATFSNFEFLMVLTSDHVTPATGLTVTGERSIDGGAFAGVTGTIAEVSNGIYQFDALAADTNGDVITWRFSSATADDTFVTIKTTT